jgi:tight adherence protein B
VLPINLQDLSPTTLIAIAATFVLVVSTWCIGILLWTRHLRARRKKLVARLETGLAEGEEPHVLRLWHEGKEYVAAVAGQKKIGLYKRYARLHGDAGFDSTPLGSLFGVSATALVLSVGAFFLFGRFVPALAVAVAVFFGFFWSMSWRGAKRIQIFERQLVDALELSARALRAGHPLLGSFRLISEEIPAPVGQLFAEICQQQALGIDLQDSLRRIARESNNMDMRLLSASLAINLSCGGNVAQVVEGLAVVIRDRMRLNRRFRVLISQTQISKRILLAMPIIMFGVLNTLNPEYMSLLYDTRPGNIMLASATFMLAMGWWMMNKMAELKV